MKNSLAYATALLLSLCTCGFELPDSTGSSSGASTGGSSSPGGSGMLPPDTTGTATMGPSTMGPSTTSGLDSGSTGMSFIEPTGDCLDPGPDGSVWHCTVDCDVIEQDCPEGEKCSAWANDGSNGWNASRCSPLSPDPVPPGGPCTVEGGPVSGVDDCEAGSICWGVDPDTLMGTCTAFCDSRDPGACADPQACLDLNDGAVPVCLTPCSPLVPGTCAPGEACRLIPVFGAYCLPEVGGTIEDNTADCGDTTCVPETACVDASLIPSCEAGCCTPWCDTSDPGADAGCAAGDPALVCAPVYRPGAAPEGLESLGMCIDPSA